MSRFSLESVGITVDDIVRNASVSLLYEEAIRRDREATISDRGALIAYSGTKTGRSPSDKRVVEHDNFKRRRVVGFGKYSDRRRGVCD